MDIDLTSASVEQIADFYATDTSSYLRANMVISADGHFVDADGSSRGLSSHLDLKVLLTLRAISDVVLVGAQTARTENYKPPALSGAYTTLNEDNPRLAIISKSVKFDHSSRLFTIESNKPIIFTEERDDAIFHDRLLQLNKIAELEIMPKPLNPMDVIADLNKKSLTKIVCEGGPNLLAQLIDLDLVDEIALTRSPIALGYPAVLTPIHQAINAWPNRISAKLGQHQLWRIKR